MTYQPSSYTVLVADAVRALQAALADGERLLEIEFPPLPTAKDGACDVAHRHPAAPHPAPPPPQPTLAARSSTLTRTCNLPWPQRSWRAPAPGASHARRSRAPQLTASGVQRIQILVPDSEELRRAEERFSAALALAELPAGASITFGALSGSRRGEWAGVADFFFAPPAAAAEELTSAADLYLACNMSCTELAELEAWWGSGRRPASAVLCCFNLELDTHRGDLGLFGFPGKELHHRFLSRIRPAFFLRQREYSKTVSAAPFLLNYAGATLREYPGPWQVMLRTDDGSLACIAERPRRYGLGEAKEELLAAMGLNTEAEGSALSFLRRGYKTATWWEESTEAESDAWRS